MARPIRCQTRYPWPAEAVYAALVDADYLRARLDRIGGTDAALLDHAADAETAKYTVRQGASRESLPAPIQKIMGSGLAIERTETWRRAGQGRYWGTVAARVMGAPAAISGTLGLVEVGGGTQPGSEMSVDGVVKVDLPLVGSKIESAIAEQVVRLMAREAQFTQQWLAP